MGVVVGWEYTSIAGGILGVKDAGMDCSMIAGV